MGGDELDVMKKIFLLLLLVPMISLSQVFKVIRVIDGDTFVIEGGERVRMIGINAPELKDPFGVESKNHLKKLIENKYVNLIKGDDTADRDYFKRLLRYVYLDEADISLAMIDGGFALAYLKYPFSKSEKYKIKELERLIKEKPKSYLGYWNYAEFLSLNIDISSENFKYDKKICDLYLKAFNRLFLLDEMGIISDEEYEIYIQMLNIYNAGFCPVPKQIMG